MSHYSKWLYSVSFSVLEIIVKISLHVKEKVEFSFDSL